MVVWFVVLAHIAMLNVFIWFVLIFRRPGDKSVVVFEDRHGEETSVTYVRYRHPLIKKSWFDRNYVQIMLWVALPNVIQGAWRSFFPQQYNERIGFWNNPMNNVFIGRSLASIGEVTWAIQVSLCLYRLYREFKYMHNSFRWSEIDNFVAFCCYAPIFICVLSQMACLKAMIQVNYFQSIV